MTLSVAIVTYQREQVLVDSIAALLALDPQPLEILVIDQTLTHIEPVQNQLQAWHQSQQIRWLHLSRPSITAAMNRALWEARSERVLFVDDDVIPAPELLSAHIHAAEQCPGALIAGRVLQPWHHGNPHSEELTPFRFNTLKPRLPADFIGCNFSVPRAAALELGGFDQNFVRVAYRYEAEFAHRWRQVGHSIRYEPRALLHHLHAGGGGTRSYGDHLTTTRPFHAVGRYYFLLRTLPLLPALLAASGALIRSIRSRHHLRRPWWIPLTLLAELWGLAWALLMHGRGPQLRADPRPRLLIATSHPIQYQVPLFQAIERQGDLAAEVLFLTIPDAQQQGVGFGVPFQWDQPLLDGYRWRQAASQRGDGSLERAGGLWLSNPFRELRWGPGGLRPDALLITGWQCRGLLQLLLTARFQRLPVLLRIESNNLCPRPFLARLWHRLLVHQARTCLSIGSANTAFYRALGVPPRRLIPAPYFVDNSFFAERASKARQQRQALRKRWGIPAECFCFLFAGKLQQKKRPLVLLAALAQLLARPDHPSVHLLIVGSGELESTCRYHAEHERLPVTFAGFLNQGDISDAYAVADALVLPSDSGETWGLVVNEAMACGLPVIVSDHVGCAADLVIHRQTGLIFPLDQVPSLAACLAQLAQSPDEARAMGEAARERVGQHYTVGHAAEAIIQATQINSRNLQTQYNTTFSTDF